MSKFVELHIFTKEDPERELITINTENILFIRSGSQTEIVLRDGTTFETQESYQQVTSLLAA